MAERLRKTGRKSKRLKPSAAGCAGCVRRGTDSATSSQAAPALNPATTKAACQP